MSASTVIGRIAAVAFVVVFALSNIHTSVVLGEMSIGSTDAPATMAELPGVSERRAPSRLATLPATCGSSEVISDAGSLTVADLEAASSAPCRMLFLSGYVGAYPLEAFDAKAPLLDSLFMNSTFKRTLHDRIATHNAEFRTLRLGPRRFDDRLATDSVALDERVRRALEGRDRSALLLESPNPTLLNDRQHGNGERNDLRLVPFASVSDRLVLLPTALTGFGRTIWRFEPDYYRQGHQMEAVGRYLSFLIVNPVPRSRLVMDFTATVDANGRDDVPPVSVIGSRRFAVVAAGRGAARLVSEPLTPQVLDGAFPVVTIDMGENGTTFPTKVEGLLRLFGTQWQGDSRQVNGFVRDISLITDDQYRAMRAPERLARFPGDLFDPGLQFSGVYEDGWISERSAFVLRDRVGARHLSIAGSIPDLLRGTTIADVSMDGHLVALNDLRSGAFSIDVSAPGDGRSHRIELHFSKSVRLPHNDDRVTAGQLQAIGFD